MKLDIISTYQKLNFWGNKSNTKLKNTKVKERINNRFNLDGKKYLFVGILKVILNKRKLYNKQRYISAF